MNTNHNQNKKNRSSHGWTDHKPRRSGSWLWILVALFVLGAATLACNRTRTSDVSKTAAAQTEAAEVLQRAQNTLSALASQTAEALPPSPTLVPPTLTPSISPSPSPTQTSTPETPTATNTPISPTLTHAVVAEKIRFQQGGTSGYRQKSISKGELHRYSVRAFEGQTLILTASSPNNDVYLDVRGLQDGRQLVWAGSQTSHWVGTLPRTQAYLVTLSTNNPDSDYFLSVEVPANIYFDRGAYSDTIDGYIDVHSHFHPDVLTRVRYLAYAFADQTMTVKLSSPNLDDLSVGVYGQADGKAYIRYQVKNDGGVIELPTTQGYYIDIYAVNGKSTEFTLKLTIK